MCGIAGYIAPAGLLPPDTARRMAQVLAHRGPDDEGLWAEGPVALANRRLAILDLSAAGHQPMTSPDDRIVMTYNGEVYNYLELRALLEGPCASGTDTEVVLRAFAAWGIEGLDRLNGMFAFAAWDRATQSLVLVRDRFGVKPLYFTEWDGAFLFASEIKALATAGVPVEPDVDTWRLYLAHGLYDHGPRTFFKGIWRVPPGHYVRWREGRWEVACWYDVARRLLAAGPDRRADREVAEEYRDLLVDSVRLRFRSDVPVAVCLSGGLDSSTLVGILHRIFGPAAGIHAYHFATGNPAYDETPWVRQLLAGLRYPLHLVLLRPEEVPVLAEEVAFHQEEPYGGLPTLAMTRLFEAARGNGHIVLLDGQGLDEQWAGYDYYAWAVAEGRQPTGAGVVQGSRSAATRPGCLGPALRGAEPPELPRPFTDLLQNWRYRDLRYAKIPRALRFSDRASSQFSCELREPCLDYRLVELAFRQPPDRLLRDGQNKYLLRRIARELMPAEVSSAPTRPVQTPQREWLRGPLRQWVESCLAHPAVAESGWFEGDALRREWRAYLAGESDNSFYVWQWITVALNDLVMDRLRQLAKR